MHSRGMNAKDFTIEITAASTRERPQNEVQGMHCVTGQAKGSSSGRSCYPRQMGLTLQSILGKVVSQKSVCKVANKSFVGAVCYLSPNSSSRQQCPLIQKHTSTSLFLRKTVSQAME